MAQGSESRITKIKGTKPMVNHVKDWLDWIVDQLFFFTYRCWSFKLYVWFRTNDWKAKNKRKVDESLKGTLLRPTRPMLQNSSEAISAATPNHKTPPPACNVCGSFWWPVIFSIPFKLTFEINVCSQCYCHFSMSQNSIYILNWKMFRVEICIPSFEINMLCYLTKWSKL